MRLFDFFESVIFVLSCPLKFSVHLSSNRSKFTNEQTCVEAELLLVRNFVLETSRKCNVLLRNEKEAR